MKLAQGKRLRNRRAYLSAGAWVIVAIAILSSAVLFRPTPPQTSGLTQWVFARPHYQMYTPLIAKWNEDHKPPVSLYLLSTDVLSRRVMSGFMSGVPVADLMEVERGNVGQMFAGPLDSIGFVDLTDRLKKEGLLDQINAPSFSPWTTRGHIFGLPHDVHPTLLCYRADIVEALGIDVNTIETWDDFVRVMQPLMAQKGPDGQPAHYALNLWYTSQDQIEALILQAGGGFFDANDKLVLDSPINAHVIATIISWEYGPNRICADAPEFSGGGNQMKLDGYVIASIMPDWLSAVWKSDMPGLKGKLKLMPLPAWEKGGRRTSVWGGTMLGIAKNSPNVEAAWTYAKYLYTSPQLAKSLYDIAGIVSPFKKMWSNPIYDEPDPFFSNQPSGRLYLNQAPNVPPRAASPYNQQAKLRLLDALSTVHDYAEANHVCDAKDLEPVAQKQLKIAQAIVQQQIDRNLFLREKQ